MTRTVLLLLLLSLPALAEPNACVKKYGDQARAVELSGTFVCNVSFPASHQLYQQFEAQRQESVTDAQLAAQLLKKAKLKCPRGTQPGVFRGVGDPQGSLVCWRNMNRTELCGSAGIDVYDQTLSCLSS